MKLHVYIIYSRLKDKYYVGYTRNPQERLLEHNAGATPSTRPGIPWEIVDLEDFTDKSLPIKRENQIKKMKSRKYIKSPINSRPVG